MTLFKQSDSGKEPVGKNLSAREFAELGGASLVYIRAVIAQEVMADLCDDGVQSDFDIDGKDVVYSVHTATGERIALIGDRDLAFATARQYEMHPVSVH